MKIKLNQNGINEIEELFDQFAEKVGNAIKDNAQELAPIDTGELKNSINNTKLGKYEYKIVAEAPYSAYVELGTEHMAAQPFIRPAVDITETTFTG